MESDTQSVSNMVLRLLSQLLYKVSLNIISCITSNIMGHEHLQLLNAQQLQYTNMTAIFFVQVKKISFFFSLAMDCLRTMGICKGIVKKDEEDKCQAAREMQNLSSDAVYEILTRVELDTLLRRCRWVCKDWQKLIICNAQFQQKHSQRTSIASGYFVQSDRNHNEHSMSFIPSVAHHSEHKSSQITYPSLDFSPESPNIVIESSSNYSSLICCITKSSTIRIPTYYICKPATREWRKMPNPRTRLKALHTGLAVTQTYPNLQFKMLRLSYTNTGFRHHCEVFDLTTWAWKRLAYIKFNIEGTMLQKRNGIFLNGGFHWFTNLGEIFVYYVDQEKWAIIKVTQEMENYIQEALCVAIYCDGKLGVLYTTKEWMEIWILEGYSTTKPIWKKKFRKDVTRMFQNSRYHPLPVGMWSNDTVMMLCDTKAVWINCNNDTCTTSEFSEPSAHELYLFRTEFGYF